MRTPMLRQTLLTLGVALAVLAGALLLLTRDANGGEPGSCGPQDLVIANGVASVDPDGCEVILTVWSIPADAAEYDLPGGRVVLLPQRLVAMVRGTEDVSAPLDCGAYQIDVFNVQAAEFLTPENIALVNDNPAEFVAWLGEHPEFEAGVAATLATEMGSHVCTPAPQPKPEPTPGPPAALPRPPGAAHPAPVVAADPAFMG